MQNIVYTKKGVILTPFFCYNEFQSGLRPVYVCWFYPQQNKTIICAVKIRKNILSGYTVE